MSVTGPKAMRALEDALRDIRREEDDVTKRIARANERVGKLRETEIGQLRALAAIRLAPETQAELSHTLSKAEDKARDMLKAHAATMAELEKALDAQERELAALHTERQTLMDQSEAHQKSLDALTGAVSDILEANAEHGQILADLDAAERMAQEADRKADQAEADREEKGRPYRQDPLFTYLWEKQYGTPGYKADALTRALDGWVARLIDYHRARPNYAMLIAIPERLREHAQRLHGDVDALEAKMAEQEMAALDAAGGKSAREALEKVIGALSALDARILSAEDEREELTEAQKQAADGGDPAFEQAVEVLAQAISTTDVSQLVADAQQTGTLEDDTAVARLEETRRRIAEETSELDEERLRLKTLASRRRELEDIEYEFKKSRYDDPRSRFGNDKLVGDFLTDFLKGGMSASAYWAKWHESQNWAGTSGPITEPWASTRRRQGGFTLPPGGFSPRPSGGFSRPRSGGFNGTGFRTGGGFGSKGGFKTGGGF